MSRKAPKESAIRRWETMHLQVRSVVNKPDVKESFIPFSVNTMMSVTEQRWKMQKKKREENLERLPGATGTSTAQGLEVNRSLAQLNSKEVSKAIHTILRPISPTDWTVTDDLAFKDVSTKEKERMQPHSFGTVSYSRECS
jgi:hypothetical protein